MDNPSKSASITRKLEDLPSDGGQAVDTLAGAALRFFIRCNDLEGAIARLGRRVAALEGSKTTDAATPNGHEPRTVERMRPAPRPRNGRPIV